MTDQTGGDPAAHRPAPAPKPAQPTSNPVFRDVLKYGAILALVIAVAGAILGGIFAGWVGIVSAVIGTLMALVFLSITALSILIANRFIGSRPVRRDLLRHRPGRLDRQVRALHRARRDR